MPKKFYTERDIEDLFQRGIRSLEITDDVVITELAYEKARQLSIQLITDRAENPPAAPVRPYISEQQTRRPVSSSGPVNAQPGPQRPETEPRRSEAPGKGAVSSADGEVEQRIRSAVIARLGNRVDATLLDNIIHRVVKSAGLK